MTAFTTLLAKDLRQIVRTWRIWVLPTLTALLAISGPITARYARELFASLGGSEFLGLLSDPTWVDAYAQWTKNLAQLLTFVVIIITASAISGEVRDGTAVLTLTKPVSRTTFVVAKFVATAALVIVSIGGGAALTYASTAVFFPGAPAGPLIQATLVWGVLALLLIAATLLGSAVFSSGGAIGVGLGVLAGLGLISLLPAASNSPSGLLGLPGLLGSGQSADVVWPVVTGLGLTVFLLATAAIAFNRREL